MTVTVQHEQTINAPLADVWAVVSDFGSILSWVVGGDEGSITLTGTGVGMLRDLVLPSVGAVQHRLDALDEEKHLITYSLTAGHPLGMESYSVTARLIEAGGERCTVEWVGVFAPEEGAAQEQMAENLKGAYANLSERLDALLAPAG